ncbi:MAG: fibronectin type III domain-containing protein [Acidobacteria bacterium]|nr:fibronectin type III domain-containing protein [Acidobacteriota bacterium]
MSTSTSATISWERPRSGSDYISGYEIWTRATEESNWSLAETTTGGRDTTSVTITGLPEATARYFRMRSYNKWIKNKNRVESDYTKEFSTEPNQPPVIAPLADQSVTEGKEIRFTVSATDDNGNLTWHMPSVIGTATLNPETGEFAWTPGVVGVFRFKFEVTDGVHTVSTSTTINVNTAMVELEAPGIDMLGLGFSALEKNFLALASGIDFPKGAEAETSAQMVAAAETGSPSHFMIEITTEPSAPVIVDIVSADSTELTISPSQLVFDALNWDRPQYASAVGVDDEVAEGAIDVSVAFSVTSADPDYDGYALPEVVITSIDDETTEIVVAGDQALETSESGDFGMFELALSRPPLSPVTVTLASSDPTEGEVEPATLTFFPENWPEVQKVILFGADDAESDGDRMYTIHLSATSDDPAYDGIAIESVRVWNLDDEGLPRRHTLKRRP